jgi:uncharacterized damage-inducible protein DinB
MTLIDIALLYEYNYWANQRILAASRQVSTAQFLAASNHYFGSLRQLLVHTLGGEYAWRMLYQHQTTDYFDKLQVEEFPTLDILVQAWQAEEVAMRAYLAQLNDEDLTSVVRYTTSEGERRERVLWHCLLHVANHGTQHRSEAAMLLTDYGASPGELDFTVFLNERSG